MQIKKLEIDGLNCLSNFKINFDVPESGDSLSVMIGENGSRKSSTLEAILRIIGAFESSKIANEKNFDFKINYIHASKKVFLIRKTKKYSVKVFENNAKVFDETGSLSAIKNKLQKSGLRIFPSRVVTFYCGVNDKFAPTVRILEKNYEKLWRNDVIEYLNVITSEKPETLPTAKRYEKRFIHCEDKLTPIYLLTLLAGNDSEQKEFICKELNLIDELQIVMELNLSNWLNLIDKDEGRRYSVNEKFYSVINFITDESETRSDLVEKIIQATKNMVGTKLFFSLDVIASLNLPKMQIYNFFERLTALFNAKIEVTAKNASGEVKSFDFSEGQRQLIKIFGMLNICKNEECLVLMDEPDAHMNPKWKYDLKESMIKAVSGAMNTQLIIATHDPLVINGMKKESVLIFLPSIDEGTGKRIINTYKPDDDTIGMGIDGLLTSEYYGLNSTLDRITQNKMERRRELLIKLKTGNITPEEEKEIPTLNNEISNMKFASILPADNLYDEFLSALSESVDITKASLSPEELKLREEKSLDIMKRLLEEQIK